MKWSISKDIAQQRNDFYSAQVKGWKAFTRNLNDKKFIKPKDYSNLGSKTHLKAIVSDPDFDKILSGFFIALISVIIIALSKGNKVKFIQNKNYNITFILLSSVPLFLWIILFPQSRYGYYAYISFFLISLFYSFNKIPKISRKVFISFMIAMLVFVSLKNLSRIFNEINKTNYTYNPIKKFRVTDQKKYNLDNVSIRVPINSRLECANIKMFCASYIESISKIRLKFGYYFIENSLEGITKHLNRSAFHDMIEVND